MAEGKVVERNTDKTPLGLLQVDFAVADDRADIGWVFGTFMYNGEMKEANVSTTLLESDFRPMLTIHHSPGTG